MTDIIKYSKWKYDYDKPYNYYEKKNKTIFRDIYKNKNKYNVLSICLINNVSFDTFSLIISKFYNKHVLKELILKKKLFEHKKYENLSKLQFNHPVRELIWANSSISSNNNWQLYSNNLLN